VTSNSSHEGSVVDDETDAAFLRGRQQSAPVGQVPSFHRMTRLSAMQRLVHFAPVRRRTALHCDADIANDQRPGDRCQLSVVRLAKSANLLAHPFENAHHGPIK
jgi:hypothetical protein